MDAFLRFWGLTIAVVIVLVVTSVLLMKKYKRYTIAKFIPTLIIWLVSIVFFVMAIFFAEPMQDLGYLVMSMIAGAAAFITLVITIVITKRMTKKESK